MSPSLKLNRLVVMKGGKRAYDQSFHSGFNIIRGDNGSGKSTIMDLIFYALGGELKDWKEHASMCNEVMAEIYAEGKLLVLKREISTQQQRQMQLFFGDFDVAMASASDGWVHAPFKRNNNNKSFSQILFGSLGIPEMPGDEGSNITMHQLLRLIYVDQSSPFQRIFRTEHKYDSKDIRLAVSELLRGIGGYELYAAKINLREKDKKFNEASAKLASILRAASALSQSLSEGALDERITKIKSERTQLFEKLKSIEVSDVDSKEIAKEAEAKRKKISTEMFKVRQISIDAVEKIKLIEYEIQDSENFIKHLSIMLKEFESSALVYTALGGVKFEKCPACHSQLVEKAEDECHLCGCKQSSEELESNKLSVKLDIEGQLVESRRLQDERRAELGELEIKKKAANSETTRLVNRLDKMRSAPVDGRANLLFETSREIGQVDAQLEELEKLRVLSNETAKLSQEKAAIQAEISTLKDKIKSLEMSQEKRRSIVDEQINENTKYFLEKDLESQKDFKELKDFKFSFEDDWFAVNGKPNISKSASGMVVIKNSLFLGILKTALTDDKMKFPRLLLLDNVEDKGMVEERIHNSQKVIADFCDDQNIEHQVIVTTSSLCEELDSDDYTIGDFYTTNNKSLKFS